MPGLQARLAADAPPVDRAEEAASKKRIFEEAARLLQTPGEPREGRQLPHVKCHCRTKRARRDHRRAFAFLGGDEVLDESLATGGGDDDLLGALGTGLGRCGSLQGRAEKQSELGCLSGKGVGLGLDGDGVPAGLPEAGRQAGDGVPVGVLAGLQAIEGPLDGACVRSTGPARGGYRCWRRIRMSRGSSHSPGPASVCESFRAWAGVRGQPSNQVVHIFA